MNVAKSDPVYGHFLEVCHSFKAEFINKEMSKGADSLDRLLKINTAYTRYEFAMLIHSTVYEVYYFIDELMEFIDRFDEVGKVALMDVHNSLMEIKIRHLMRDLQSTTQFFLKIAPDQMVPMEVWYFKVLLLYMRPKFIWLGYSIENKELQFGKPDINLFKL